MDSFEAVPAMSSHAYLNPVVLQGFIFFVAFIYIGAICYSAWFGPLSKLPGPALARYTNIWRIKNAASGQPHVNFQNLHKCYGRVVRIGPNHVSLSDPAQIQEIYGISSKYTKSRFYDTLTPLHDGKPLYSIFSTQNQAHHRILKSGIAQKYSLSSLLRLEPLVDKVTQNFVSTLRTRLDSSQNSSEGVVIDFGEWVQYYAFDVIGAITFSKTFDFIDAGKDERGVIQGLEGGLMYGGVVGQIPGLHPWLLGSPRVEAVLASIPPIAASNPVPIVKRMITDALASADENPKDTDQEDFLTFLKKQNEKDGKRITEVDMMNHMFVNLLAGSDTTAISLRTIFYLLAKSPNVYSKLQAEIDAADHAGLLSPVITYAESQAHIPYLALVVKEALRYHPAVSLTLERIVPEGGLQIGEQYIPNNTIVGMNAWVLHRDKSVFGEDADDFRPERWEVSDNGVANEQLKRMEKSFFAFGHGARTCIGKNISLMEMGKFVPQFLREFEMEWAGREEWKVQATWFAKQSNVLLRLRSKARQAASIADLGTER